MKGHRILGGAEGLGIKMFYSIASTPLSRRVDNFRFDFLWFLVHFFQ